jgi:hypothetical protein
MDLIKIFEDVSAYHGSLHDFDKFELNDKTSHTGA